MRIHTTITLLLLACGFANAEPGGMDSAAPCVQIEVNGERVQSFSCLTSKLMPPHEGSRARPAGPTGAEAIVQRPGNQLGVFNRAATSHRMGNTFGTSVLPQRPDRP